MRYETELDRQVEEQILQDAQLRTGRRWDAHKLSGKNEARYHADYFITDLDSKRSFWLEVKDRPSWPVRGWASVLLDVCKYRNLRNLATTTGLPAIFMPRLAGVLYSVNLTEDHLRLCGFAWRGRTDRNDPDDGQPCIFIPLTLFTEVGA